MSDLRGMREFWNKTTTFFGRQGYNAVLIPTSKGLLNWYIDYLQKTALNRNLQEFRGRTALDLGCGVGRWSSRLAELGVHVVAIDFSREMVVIAKGRTSLANRIRTDFVVASASMLPFVKQAFEACLSVTVLQHIVDEKAFRRAASEIIQIIKDGGEIVLLELSSLYGHEFGTEFPTTNHPYEIIMVGGGHFKLAEVRGVDPSLLLKFLNRIAGKYGRYGDILSGKNLGLKYTLLSSLFYLLVGLTCFISMPFDLAFRNFLLRFSDHKVMVFRSSRRFNL
jgi:SAM-dependent methyltransferase